MTLRKDFLWGGATSSYQCEGGFNEGGRVPSMWDEYLHLNNLENGDVASDHYHHFEEDIKMMKEGGQNSYRFSIAWPRIIKNLETKRVSGFTEIFLNVVGNMELFHL